ncbi:MAG: sensor histidine kinase, partial [Candidatus Promineifilaceae bacterium]
MNLFIRASAFMKDRTEENRTRQNYLLLLISMGLIGFGLIAVSVMNVLQQPFESALSNLLLLMGLAAISSLLLKVTPSFGSARFAYDVGSGLSIAALAYYGLSGAVLISTTIALTTWLLHQGRTHPSKRSYAQLIFNTGMLNIASFFAYLAFRGIVGQLDPNASLIVVGWIVAAVTYELANRAVLALIVQTTNVDGDGRSVFLAGGWTDTLLTMMINFVGAGLVGYAMKQHDWRGIVIFFIPVLLSSIAYLIHVRSAGVYMSQLEEMVQTRTQEREQVSREKDMFLRVLTHDMKTPLAVIRAYTQLLSRNPEFAVSKPKYLASLGSAEATLSRLVNDISELEVWSKGSKVVLKRVDTDLNKLMGRAVELISAESAAQKLIITSTPADGTPCAHIDPHHIER